MSALCLPINNQLSDKWMASGLGQSLMKQDRDLYPYAHTKLPELISLKVVVNYNCTFLKYSSFSIPYHWRTLGH
jgi:hypothetical protein